MKKSEITGQGLDTVGFIGFENSSKTIADGSHSSRNAGSRCIGRINDFADLLGISEKGDHLLSDPAPALNDGRQLFPPGTLGKILKPLGCQLRRLGFIDLLEFPGNRLAQLPVAEAQVIANQVDAAKAPLPFHFHLLSQVVTHTQIFRYPRSKACCQCSKIAENAP